MPAFQFESNLPIILLIIVIALVSLYFYLDLKKVKLSNEELESKNEIIVKEIDNIHLQMHKFFSRMPQSIVPKVQQNQSKVQQDIKENKEVSNKVTDKEEVEEIVSKMVDDTVKSVDISENEFNNLRKQSSNNIFGEIEEIISDNNITQENNIDKREIDEDIVLPDLVPVKYESDNIESNDTEEDDEVDDITDNSDNENISDDLDEELLDKYMKMSAKDLKEKCVEMNLKHTGNKSTLARRIVENLE